jgi:hypothetical protein
MDPLVEAEQLVQCEDGWSIERHTLARIGHGHRSSPSRQVHLGEGAQWYVVE